MGEPFLAASLEALEFDLPCAAEGCGGVAASVLAKSHTDVGCWGPGRALCVDHAYRSMFDYGLWLSDCEPGDFCMVCFGEIAGGLSVNIRVIEL